MANFKKNQKVFLNIAGMLFEREVLEVIDGCVYLKEGGNAFDDDTGFIWESDNNRIFIFPKD